MTDLPGFHVGSLLHDSHRSLVYRARRVTDDQSVILKLLKGEYPRPAALDRFREEFAISRHFKFEGVVKALDLVKVGNTLMMVLEDVGGQALNQVMRRREFDLEDVLDIGIQVARILGQVHAAEVIHKDINPSNIIYNEITGEVSLIDFGISTRLSVETPTLAPPNTLEGTLKYLSPEQTGRMNRTLDYRTDFYSLGATLYHLLAGEPPFDSEDPMELVHCHIARRPESLSDMRSSIPANVASVIEKLMSKTAEGRYQSSSGLIKDLELCLKAIQDEVALENFKPGLGDHRASFHIPQKLYGREEQVATLLHAFENIRLGQSGLSLISGSGGIGKSSLVAEVHKPVTQARGYFISGKYDQYSRIPYQAIAHAFGQLMTQIIAEGPDRLAYWRGKLQQVLGSQAGVIAEIIPELKMVMGEIEAVPELDAREASARFRNLFTTFLKAFCAQEHPLVVFIDDLQWADLMSLSLMAEILRHSDLKYCFLIGAYRNVAGVEQKLNELRDLVQTGIEVYTIHLKPLSLEHLISLLSETLSCSRRAVDSLARLVLQKTAGNPFFIRQFLQMLHSERLLTYQAEGSAMGVGWHWDVAAIEAKSFTDNVVDLMVDKLQKIPEKSRHVLTLAGCMGQRFTLEPLSDILGQSVGETFKMLFPAMREGLVLPVSEPESGVAEGGFVPHYKFLHDRVQQASIELLDEAERAGVHLKIGLQYMDSEATKPGDKGVFSLVDHLNRARHLGDAAYLRPRLLIWNMRAGSLARNATAFPEAFDYFEVALELLKDVPDYWDAQRELAFKLYLQLGETAHLIGNSQEAEQLLLEARKHHIDQSEMLQVFNHLLVMYTTASRFQEAVQLGLEVLAEMGIQLTESEDRTFKENHERIRKALDGRPIYSLLERPLCEDTCGMIQQQVLANLTPIFFFASPTYFDSLITEHVLLAIGSGLTAASASAFAIVGGVISSRMGLHEEGYRWTYSGLEVARRTENLYFEALACHTMATFVIHWLKPLSESVSMAERGIQAGLASGNFQWASFAMNGKIRALFAMGYPLGWVREELERMICQARMQSNRTQEQRLEALAFGLNELVSSEDDAEKQGDFQDWKEKVEASRDFHSLAEGHMVGVVVCYILGQDAQVLDFLKRLEGLATSVRGSVYLPLLNMCHSLVLLRGVQSVEGHEEALALVGENQKLMSEWAKGCPQTYAHKYDMVCAEVARVEGDWELASDLYDRAIEGASEGEFLNDEAIACELAASFWLGRKKRKVAAVYMRDACQSYLLWGASKKLAQLQESHAALLNRDTVSMGMTATATATGTDVLAQLDLGSVMKASRAISSEIVLDELLKTLMGITLENAGAERGFLLLYLDGQWVIRAQGLAPEDGGLAALSEPLHNAQGLSQGIVHYVIQSRQSLVLEDASNKGIFMTDEYVLRARSRSLLCLPMIHQGQLTGILYLENNLVTHAFTPARLELLKLLVSQAAVALENAYLYENQERLVTERTAALKDALNQVQEKHAQLKSAQGKLVQAEKMAGLVTLTAGVAHELKNPLNFINNFAQLNEDIALELDDYFKNTIKEKNEEIVELMTDLRQNCQAILKHGQLADQTVKGMENLVRGRETSEGRRPVSLNEHLDEFIALAAGSKNTTIPVKIHKNYDASIGKVIMIAKDLGRVWINLINNSIDAFGAKLESEPGFKGEIHFSTARNGDWVEIRVRDNGTGMPESHILKIFEPFYTTKPPGEGNIGLGLSICYDIVTKTHKGTIEVKAEPGAYTEFVVCVPFEEGL